MSNAIKILVFSLAIVTQSSRIMAQCHPDDFDALRALYLRTDGDNWLDTVGWSLVRDNAIPPANCHLGSMSGIQMYFVGPYDGRVKDVYLPGRGMKDTLPTAFFHGLDFVTRIHLADNEISNVDTRGVNLVELKTLNLSSNRITQFPSVVTSLTSLTSLNLSENQFTDPSGLPDEIGNLVNLQELIINESGLSGTIPPEIGNLTQLTELSLQQNQLKGSLPKEMANLKILRILRLDSPLNHISDSNEFSGYISFIGDLDSLRSLSLGNNAFKVPLLPEIGNLKKLVYLNLFRGGFIGPIPAEIGELEELGYFDGSYNNFTSLPSTIGDCKNLQHLILRNTLIDSIPSGVGGMDSLTIFNLSGSNVSYLDPDIGSLLALESLFLNLNPLNSVPQEIGQLENLRTLSLRNCGLSEIPSSLENLNQLKTLDIANNFLSGHLPCFFGNMDSLEYIDMVYNNFNGCYDNNLLSLCGATLLIGGYEDILERGNNLPDWDGFCDNQLYTCPAYKDSVYWELEDTGLWNNHIIWDGRQIPSQYEHVIIKSQGNPLYTTGAIRQISIDNHTTAQAYSLEIDNGVNFNCTTGSTLEIFSSSGYEYQSTCEN